MKKELGHEAIYDARQLGTPRMLVLGLQHMFAMFGATVLVPILVQGYGLPLSIQTTLLFAGLGTLLFHVCTKMKVPAFLGSSFAYLGGFETVAKLDAGKYAGMSGDEKLAYALGGIVIAGLLYLVLALLFKMLGAKKVMRYFPPIVTGPMIIMIGLNLSGSAINNAATCWWLALIAMATFRSPAVALMPDVTIKPLRSKANAVINLMGTAGGILVLILGMVFATSSAQNSMMSYTGYFSVIAGIMLLALTIFMWKVREPKLVRRMQEESKIYGIEENSGEDDGEKHRLGKAERRSLLLLLASIVLWFMGYNAVTSKYSVYASNVLNKDYNMTLMIAQGAAILAYLPVGMVASKVGRKKTILAGVTMLTAAFGVACFLNENSPTLLMNCMFALAGIGWATINVNSFPMVVEMCRGGDVGKYTGIYYTASMAAQTVTPMFSGLLMDELGMTSLFPYATVFVALAFVTMLFVMHGDNKPVAKKGLEALDVED